MILVLFVVIHNSEMSFYQIGKTIFTQISRKSSIKQTDILLVPVYCFQSLECILSVFFVEYMIHYKTTPHNKLRVLYWWIFIAIILSASRKHAKRREQRFPWKGEKSVFFIVILFRNYAIGGCLFISVHGIWWRYVER